MRRLITKQMQIRRATRKRGRRVLLAVKNDAVVEQEELLDDTS